MASSWADPTLTGRTALVTGASRGIGRAIAERLGGAGAALLLVSRGGADLEAAAAATGGHAFAVDIADALSVERLAEAVHASIGGAPDIVVNAAGAFALAAVEETATADFDRQIAVNLRGPFLVMRAFLGAMRGRGSGHVVTVGSVAGRHAFLHNGAYAASKFGVRGLHAVLDAELRGSGVRSTLIEPAATDTTLWDAVDRERHGPLPERHAMLAPSAVADAVLYAVTRPVGEAVRTIILERA
jgi:NAD(P)-dependent dehydrogenase (short-subunit alcohol dehydrogenase family)